VCEKRINDYGKGELGETGGSVIATRLTIDSNEE